MPDRRTINQHAALVNRMAEANGVNLTDLLDEGRLSSEEWRDAVIRCTGCDDPGACVHWLADHAEGAETPPDYCRNTDLLARLAVD